MAKISPMQIYKLLPKINCKECGEETCMAFASKLIERSKKIEDCPPLMKEEHKELKEKLKELLSPPVKEITIGRGKGAKKIGGEEVIFRHELTYFNPTVIALDVSDDMPKDEIVKRVSFISKFYVEKIGKKLRFDAIAVRGKTNDATSFGDAVLSVSENTDLPIILCSYNPEILEVGLEVALEKRPLIYAATPENYKKVAGLAKKHNAPLVVSCPNNVEALLNLVREIRAIGVEDIVLDPGTEAVGDKFGEAINNFAILRKLAIEEKVKEAMFPILGVPMVAYLNRQDNGVEAEFEEAVIAASEMLRYSDIMIMHSSQVYLAMPLLTLRMNLYTDPRVPVSVESKLYAVGEPNESSPVFLTTNFALTYFTLSNDLESAKIPCYVLVANTEGLAVEVSMAGKKLTADVVKEIIEKSKIEEKIKHRRLIIPGVAARIKGELEDATKWEIIVGPRDSSQIPDFLGKVWKK